MDGKQRERQDDDASGSRGAENRAIVGRWRRYLSFGGLSRRDATLQGSQDADQNRWEADPSCASFSAHRILGSLPQRLLRSSMHDKKVPGHLVRHDAHDLSPPSSSVSVGFRLG